MVIEIQFKLENPQPDEPAEVETADLEEISTEMGDQPQEESKSPDLSPEKELALVTIEQQIIDKCVAINKVNEMCP